MRIMPGSWPRLRGGRKARMYQANANARFLQFVTFRSRAFAGGAGHTIQFYSGTAPSWKWLRLGQNFYEFDPYFSEPIETAYDGSFGATNPVAAAQLDFGVVLYNGLGVRDASSSRPPFTSATSESNQRYFGLDAYCPTANPVASFQAGAGENQVITSVEIFVGLYNTATQHFSNAVYAGTITTTPGKGTISVANLSDLKSAYHNPAEEAELKYVFYATIDGGKVPYLVMDSTGINPQAVAITQSSASLSTMANTINGWLVNFAAEMPTENFPPKPMRDLAYVNGRLYGVRMDGGSGTSVLQTNPEGTQRADFTYTGETPPGIVFSSAYGDSISADFLGDPLQSWPLANFSPTPNAEIPLKIAAAPGGKHVLVITPTATFVVAEAGDGIHEWLEVSPIDGIGKRSTFAVTAYGAVWVNQRNQIMLLDSGLSLSRLSGPYQPLLDGKTVQAGAYVLDPPAEVDRYEAYLSDGTAVIHDFLVGQASTATNHNYTAVTTLTDHMEQVHHLAARRHLYTRETQPYGGGVVTADEDFDGSGQVEATEISGRWTGQWRDFGDSNLRKELAWIDLLCDPNFQVRWWKDLEVVADTTGQPLTGEKTPQADSDLQYRFKLSGPHAFWYKFRFTVQGRSSEASTYPIPGDQAAMGTSVYGAILRALATVSQIGGNRA